MWKMTSLRSSNRLIYKTRKARKARRSRRGVMMGVADLMIVIPIFTIGVFILTDLAQLGFYKERFSTVLSQSANYAVSLPPDADPEIATAPVVRELCAQNNLALKNMTVEVKKITVADCEAISVKAIGYVPLLPGGALPAIVPIQDAAAALYPANRVYGVIAINPYPYSAENPTAQQSVYIPIIRPRSGTSIWQFPYDSALNNLHVVQGTVPPPPTPDSVVSYFKERPSLY